VESRIRLANGSYVLVDNADLDLLNRFTWVYQSSGYASAQTGGRKNRKTFLMHRLLTEAPDDCVVDHKNGNKLDNRRSNLRVTSSSNNLANSKIRKDNSSGYKGVYLHTKNKNWIARIQRNNKMVHLGSFDNPHDAARMYNFWAKDMFGEYARLNVIKEEAN
jgi:hypothetical protein